MDDRGNKILEGLKEYLENTSPEQLKRDWEELEPYNHFGPTMEECLELGRENCMRMMREMDESSTTSTDSHI